ncbi:MAG: MATE family efflux transporter [Bacteroidales bacterium]|nr:MATE family efflux transporter [Candidatus Scybalousia scybalohippi]
MQANEEKALRLGREKIGKLLYQFSLPAIAAMIASSLYNIVDGIFIGNMNDYAISGVGLTAPFMNLAAAFGALIGVGASVLCSIFLGEKNYEKARQTLCNVIILNLIIGIAVTIIGLIFLDPILMFFGASENTLPYAREYMKVILYGNVFAHSYLGMNSIFRVSGYPNTAMYITFVSVLINIILAPIFIFVLDWGVAGAAWATVSAQIICCLVQLYLFMRRDRVVYIEKDKFRLDKQIVARSFAIGSPNFAQNAAACFVVVLQNFALLKYGGDLYIGAFSIINRIIFLFIMVIIGFSQGMQPIVAYNFGAKNYDRMWNAFFLTAKCALVTSLVGCLIGEVFPRAITSIFVAGESNMIEITVDGFHKNMAMFWQVGFQIIGTNFFAAMAQPKKSMFLSLTRQVIFLIPLLIFLPPMMGYDGVWFATPIADTIATFTTLTLIIREYRLHKKQNLLH